MQVPVDSHPYGPPKHVVEPSGYAVQGMVASYLALQTQPLPQSIFYYSPRVSRKGLVSVKLWQTLSLKDASEDFIMFLWRHTPPHCLVSARLTIAWDASGRRKLDSKQHWPGQHSKGRGL